MLLEPVQIGYTAPCDIQSVKPVHLNDTAYFAVVVRAAGLYTAHHATIYTDGTKFFIAAHKLKPLHTPKHPDYRKLVLTKDCLNRIREYIAKYSDNLL